MEQAFADLPGGDKLTVVTVERRVIDLECHRQRRFVDDQCRQFFRRVRVAQRVRDTQFLDPADGNDIAGGRLLDFSTLKPEQAVYLQYPAALDAAVGLDHRHV